MNSKIRWRELVLDLIQFSNKNQLAKRLGTSIKEVDRWLKGHIPNGKYSDLLFNECRRYGKNPQNYSGLMPVYDFRVSYEKNVENGPHVLTPPLDDTVIPSIPTSFLGHNLNSPLGVPASILTINSKWIEPLVENGFDIITAKTVRTKNFFPHPIPNALYLPDLQSPVRIGSLGGPVYGTSDIPGLDVSKMTLANSFGVPSPDPKEWQEDLARTKSILKSGQMLIASIVGTVELEAKPQANALINDFIRCAHLAAEINPEAIELNFSCPNTYGMEGSIYHVPEIAGTICSRLGKELPGTKILLKIGYLDPGELQKFFSETYKRVHGFTAINTLPANICIKGQKDEPAFKVKGGISGVAIRNYGLEMVRRLRSLSIDKQELVIIGCGGISSLADVKQYQDAGADAFQMCTAPIFNPSIAIEIRKQWSREKNSQNQSTVLKRAGVDLPFSDTQSAEAFDRTIRAAERLGIDFEIAIEALQKNWLNDYLQQIRHIKNNPGGIQKTRREVPSSTIIEAWLKDAAKKTR
jgi:dihydroorotate dehydrogenase (NAD+) catalytic subunit